MEQRHLSVAEYFSILQKEYLIAEFRKCFYSNSKDKAFYSKVMLFKKSKIENIAVRNSLKTIFDDSERYDLTRRELFNESGYPTFEMSESDIRNYYSDGSYFSYNGDVWILEWMKDGVICLKSDDKSIETVVSLNIGEACRIL